MTLAEQAARRVEQARHMAREPIRWIATDEAAATLREEATGDAWSADGGAFLGVVIESGRPRSEYGLDLICAPSV